MSMADPNPWEQHSRAVQRLSRLSKRALIAEAHRQGKHVTVLFPPLPQWSRDELVALLAPTPAAVGGAA